MQYRFGGHRQRVGALLGDDLDANGCAGGEACRAGKRHAHVRGDSGRVDNGRTREHLAGLGFVASRHENANRAADFDASHIGNCDRRDDLESCRIDDPQDDVRCGRFDHVAEQRPNALAVPAEAVLHEDEDAFVMVAGSDNKAHKRKVEIGLTTPGSGDRRRSQGGRRGNRAGSAGPARRGGDRNHAMSLSSFVERFGRAILTVTVLLAIAGLLSAFSLPSDIYPPLIFPRILAIGHSGTLPGRTMMLTVTRPIEQTLMEVPGVRRVRSTTFRGATEISAQFDPTTDMVVALQQAQGKVAEIAASSPQTWTSCSSG